MAEAVTVAQRMSDRPVVSGEAECRYGRSIRDGADELRPWMTRPRRYAAAVSSIRKNGGR